MSDHRQILLRYLPAKAVDIVYEWIIKYQIFFRITKSRESKLGDYMPPKSGSVIHTITINFDLNPFAFLIIFIHELAHLVVYETYGHKVLAHGKEWKLAFQGLMLSVTNEQNIFPPEIALALVKYMKNPKATLYSDLPLTRALINLNSKKTSEVLVDDLPILSLFKTSKGEVFRIDEKRRKKIKCTCLRNKHIYLFNPSALVQQYVN